MPSHNVVILQSTFRSTAQALSNRSITGFRLLPGQTKQACHINVSTDSNAAVVSTVGTYVKQSQIAAPSPQAKTLLPKQAPSPSLSIVTPRPDHKHAMSSRQSSHGGSPGGSHTPSSTSYHSQQPNQQQRYLSPTDVYRMDREGNYFADTSLSYTQSRHGSSNSSPGHSDVPPHQRLPSQSFSPSSFDPYAYQPSSHGPFFSPARRMTPPEHMEGYSRHDGSHNDSLRESPREISSDRGERSQSGFRKDKGKAKGQSQTGDDRRRSNGNGRHDPGGKSSGRNASGPANRLVSGVFIRY